jgi:hypothetical protein
MLLRELLGLAVLVATNRPYERCWFSRSQAAEYLAEMVCAKGWELDVQFVKSIAMLSLLGPARPGPTKTAACLWATAAATRPEQRVMLSNVLNAAVSADIAAPKTQKGALGPVALLKCLVR